MRPGKIDLQPTLFIRRFDSTGRIRIKPSCEGKKGGPATCPTCLSSCRLLGWSAHSLARGQSDSHVALPGPSPRPCPGPLGLARRRCASSSPWPRPSSALLLLLPSSSSRFTIFSNFNRPLRPPPRPGPASPTQSGCCSFPRWPSIVLLLLRFALFSLHIF